MISLISTNLNALLHPIKFREGLNKIIDHLMSNLNINEKDDTREFIKSFFV
jgi:hypothetical protein